MLDKSLKKNSRALQMSYLEEVLHTLRIVTVALSADSLHFFDLTSFTGSLDVFEVNLWILAEVHNGAQEVEQTCRANYHILCLTSDSFP